MVGPSWRRCSSRKPFFGVTDDDLLLKEDAEPFGGVLVGAREGESARGNFAAIAGDGEGDFAEVGGVVGADEMDGGSALAVDPFAVDGVEGPGAIEGEAAGGADAGFGNGDGIERFDGVKTDVDEVRGRLRRRHGESLAEESGKEAIVTATGVWLRSCHGPAIPVKNAGRKIRAPARKQRGPAVPSASLRAGGMTEAEKR